MMKKYYSTLVFCLLLNSCFYEGKREVASATSGTSCDDSLVSFLGRDADPSVEESRRRTKEIQSLVDEGNHQGVIRKLAETHDNGTKNFRVGDLLHGSDVKIDRKLRKLRKKTDTYYVPAYFQLKDHADVYSTIYQAADGRAGLNTHEAEAMEDISQWCDEYESYWDNLAQISLRGTEAKRIVNAINEYKRKGLEFPVELEIPYLRKDGTSYTDKNYFRSPGKLDLFLESKVGEYNRSFSVDKLDDSFSRGDTYDEFYRQAERFRRLELVYDRLDLVGSESLAPKQKELFERIRVLLEERPELRPRSREVAKLQRKELWSERRAKWRFWYSRSRKEKFPLPPAVIKVREKLSPTGLMVRYTGLLTASSFAGSLVASTKPILEEYARLQFVLALIENYRNDVKLAVFKTTPELVACAKSERVWSFKEINSNALLLAHYSRFIYKSRYDENYEFTTDQSLKEKKKEMRKLCIRKKDEYRYALHHEENAQDLEIAEREVLDGYFIELLIEEEGASDKLVSQVEELFFLSNTEDDEKVVNVALDKIRKEHKELGITLTQYLATANEAAQKLKSYGPASRHEDLKSFIKAVQEK